MADSLTFIPGVTPVAAKSPNVMSPAADLLDPPPPAPLVQPPVAAQSTLRRPVEVKPDESAVEIALAKARAVRGKTKTYELEVPIVIGGTVYQNLILRRPRWVQLEKALASPMVQRGQATENLAMISAVTGVPIAALADADLGLDLVDGMNLMREIQDFFPQARPANPQPTSEQSSETSGSDGAGAAATS